MHHAARRFFNAIHPEIQYHGGCAVRIGSGIKLHLGQRDQLAVPQNRDGCGIIFGTLQFVHDIFSRKAEMPVDRHDLIVHLQARCLAFWVFTLEVINDLAGHSATAGHKYQQQDKAQHKIHQGTGGNHKKALPGACFHKAFAIHRQGEQGNMRIIGMHRSGGSILLFRRFCPLLLVRVLRFFRGFTGKVIVTAQRQQTHGITGAAPDGAPQRRAEPDGKFLHMDAAVPGGKKMPGLMHQHHRAKYQNCHNRGQQKIHKHLAYREL